MKSVPAVAGDLGLSQKGEPGLGRPLSNWQLVLAARCGNDQAKQELFRRHLRACYRFARRINVGADDVSDIVQESLALALERFESLRDPRRFTIWLSQLVLSTSHRAARRHRLRDRVGDLPAGSVDPDELAAHSPAPEDIVRISSLRRALSELSEDDRTVLFLRRVETATVEEMSRTLDLSPSTVKRRIARADVSLGEALHGRKASWHRRGPRECHGRTA